MSPTKDQKERTRTPTRAAKGRGAANDTVEKETRKTEILRSAHLHRSRAHTSSVGRRRQARRDTK